MTFSLFFACRRPLPGVPAALPCGRHHVYIYHIVHSLLMHAYFDQLGIHPHPQHKLVQEDKQKLHLVQDTEVWNLVIGALATARARSHDLHFSILHSLIFVSLLHSLRVRILTVHLQKWGLVNSALVRDTSPSGDTYSIRMQSNAAPIQVAYNKHQLLV